MVELGTKDMHFSSTGNWASQWRHLRESWWVEEDEFQALSDILVVQSKLKHNAHQWWIEVVWWTLASGFSRGQDLGWSLSKGTKDAEGIIAVVNFILEVKWHETTSSKSNSSSATQW
jgi:hypothetical protein